VDTLPRFSLLGLVHGHFDVDVLKKDLVAYDGLVPEAINMGIAVVVPAQKILDVIDLFSDEEKPIVDAARNARDRG
jgi:hypothetical protein